CCARRWACRPASTSSACSRSATWPRTSSVIRCPASCCTAARSTPSGGRRRTDAVFMALGAELGTHAIFLVLVARAVYAQALTGFALALILLGLIGVTNLVPLPDAVNATSVLGFCTAWIFLWRRRALHIDRLLVPLLATSAVGIAVGALL